MYWVGFALAGYLMGSVLFAPLFGQLLAGKDILAGSRDNNPGTANAYMQGGFLCGTLTLLCDLAKGFIPVYLCMRFEADVWEMGMALVIAAPVLGHTFSAYHRFHGGKGIATTFGALLGLVPDLTPALVMAMLFILFSLVIRISPHFYRTIITYLCVCAALFFGKERAAVKAGFVLITLIVCTRMHLSSEEREKCRVGLLWMH